MSYNYRESAKVYFNGVTGGTVAASAANGVVTMTYTS